MDYAAALLAENRLFAELMQDADQSTPVPTCPDWTFKQLLRHVGRGDRWAAQIVDQRLTQPPDPRTVTDGKPPDDPQGVADWLHGGAQAVVDAVERVGADAEVWTFLGPQPAAWWLRRRLHEVAVHRADAALALGAAFLLSPELAADGLGEWLERVAAQATNEPFPLATNETLRLRAQGAGEWTLLGHRDGVELVSGADATRHDATATVTGPPVALLLATVRRRPADDPELRVDGDAAVWRRWLDHTPF